MKDMTDITIILDKSGSMSSTKNDVIGGFNGFLDKQQTLPGEAIIGLVEFNGKVDVKYTGLKLSEAPRLTAENYQPSGSTALYDAVGMTIDAVGQRLAALPESERPNKVILVVLTDGEENMSKEYSLSAMNDRISVQMGQYNWQILFIGSTPQAVAASRHTSISPSSMMRADLASSYVTSFGVLSSGLECLRSYNDMEQYTSANVGTNFFEAKPADAVV